MTCLRILGIDPGLRCTGFGVVDADGAQLAYVASGLYCGAALAVAPGATPTASQAQGSDYGNAADKKPTPSQDEIARDANKPSPSVLDDNAQRAHDPSQAATPRPSTEPTAGTTRDGRTVDMQPQPPRQ